MQEATTLKRVKPEPSDGTPANKRLKPDELERVVTPEGDSQQVEIDHVVDPETRAREAIRAAEAAGDIIDVDALDDAAAAPLVHEPATAPKEIVVKAEKLQQAKDATVFDLKEFWHVGRDLDEGHPLARFMEPNIWPAEVPEFEPTMRELFNAFDASGSRIRSVSGARASSCSSRSRSSSAAASRVRVLASSSASASHSSSNRTISSSYSSICSVLSSCASSNAMRRATKSAPPIAAFSFGSSSA